MGRISPYSLDTVESAYAARCALVNPLKVGRGESPDKPWSKLSKKARAEFTSTYKERHNALSKAAEVETTTPSNVVKASDLDIDALRVKTGVDLTSIIEAAVAAALGNTTEAISEDEPTVPEDGDLASNRMLWRLNREGLLSIRSEADPFNPILKERGTSTLEALLGPLPERDSK